MQNHLQKKRADFRSSEKWFPSLYDYFSFYVTNIWKELWKAKMNSNLKTKRKNCKHVNTCFWPFSDVVEVTDSVLDRNVLRGWLISISFFDIFLPWFLFAPLLLLWFNASLVPIALVISSIFWRFLLIYFR